MTDGAQTWANVDVAFKDGYQRGLSEGRKAGLMEAVEILAGKIDRRPQPQAYVIEQGLRIHNDTLYISIKAIEAAAAKEDK